MPSYSHSKDIEFPCSDTPPFAVYMILSGLHFLRRRAANIIWVLMGTVIGRYLLFTNSLNIGIRVSETQICFSGTTCCVFQAVTSTAWCLEGKASHKANPSAWRLSYSGGKPRSHAALSGYAYKQRLNPCRSRRVMFDSHGPTTGNRPQKSATSSLLAI